MKEFILSISFFCIAVSTEAQSFEEYISVNAYPHYTLKIAKHEQNGVVLIPKDERIDSFSLFVSISQFDENRHSLSKVLNKFKEAVDTTSTISIIEQEEKQNILSYCSLLKSRPLTKKWLSQIYTI